MQSQLLGLGVAGFRDIRTPAHIAPLGRLTVLGGVNNAGKSSILDAVRRLFGPLVRGEAFRTGAIKLNSLDAPDESDYDWAKTVPKLGLLLQLGEEPGDPAMNFVRAMTLDQKRSLQSSEQAAINEFLSSLSGTAYLNGDLNAVDPLSLWCWFRPAQAMGLDETFETELVNAPRSKEVLRMILAGDHSGAMTWGGALERLVRNAVLPESLQFLSGQRRITTTQHRETALPSTHGEGFAGMLLSLQSPPAREYRAAKRRHERITRMVQMLLRDESAELLVPHNAETVHVAIEGKVLPISHLGSGVEQLIILGVTCSFYEESLVLIEEPEVFLHPRLQRELLRILVDHTSNRYIMTTHSPAMLDMAASTVIRVQWASDAGTTATRVSLPSQRAQLTTDLGLRPSDLVLANAVIWVEGPSDRLYLNAWISSMAPRLREGIHYSFVMYGGQLAQHISADDPGDPRESSEGLEDLLEIVRINRNCIFIMDSDVEAADGMPAAYKVRISTELRPYGVPWITAGYTLENYLEPDVFREAYRQTHPVGAAHAAWSGDRYSNPFSSGVQRPDKVEIARNVVKLSSEVPDVLDLHERMREVCRYLADASDEGDPFTLASGVEVAVGGTEAAEDVDE